MNARKDLFVSVMAAAVRTHGVDSSVSAKEINST